ncbi:hypothetical protein [Actinokineospora iranica]|uniref:Uncharacterized protein n=1 Tax=Actinokineospora iranica TaxID=1271860 RepID=A0A1G6Y7H5_9PSEU|nr:hypothetical protein [Actinokineospora iranica]SDD85535.1 hypothetical protein SAMN05216174_12031 [Actinokineospora iranica]
METVAINTASFAEYAAGDRRRRTEIIASQHDRARVPGHNATLFYRPILAAIHTAVSAQDPEAALTAIPVPDDLTGQARAFAEVTTGFLHWWRQTKATPIPTATTTLRVADLDVEVAPHLGIRTRQGAHHAVLLYLKEAPLPRDAANAALRLLQIRMSDLIPGATPLVVDVRRAKEHRLPKNTNTTTLDAWLTAEASAYTSHWHGWLRS